MCSLSQGVVLTTATVLSCTLFYVAFSCKIISVPSFISRNSNSQESKKQILRSCLCSGEMKVERKEKKKMKKVKFADNVKEERDGREKEERKKQYRKARNCREEMEEIMRMPANRMALYNGILKDRLRNIKYS